MGPAPVRKRPWWMFYSSAGRALFHAILYSVMLAVTVALVSMDQRWPLILGAVWVFNSTVAWVNWWKLRQTEASQ